MKEKKDLTFKILVIIAIVVPVIIGFTYAYFQVPVIGVDAPFTGKSSTKFEIELVTENDGYISAEELSVIPSTAVAEKSQKGYFSVVAGDNDNNIAYAITLTNLTISSNLRVSDFKWQLYNVTTESITASGTFLGVSASTYDLKTNILITPNTTHDYELSLWLQETANNQISLLNGSFKGKVLLTSYLVNS